MAMATHGVYSGSDDVESNLENYGRLYNGYAVITEQVCPIDLHVPSIQEWEELFEENLTYSSQGKSRGLLISKLERHRNESGMSLAAGGYRGNDGYAGEQRSTLAFWTGNRQESLYNELRHHITWIRRPVAYSWVLRPLHQRLTLFLLALLSTVLKLSWPLYLGRSKKLM